MIKFTSQQIQDIVNLYVRKNKSTCEIAKIYDVSVCTILRRLRHQNITIKNSSDSHKKYTIDENYFDSIDCEDKAYFLGLMFADGYNNTDKSDARITLQAKDKKILEQFNCYIKSNKPLRKDRQYIKLVMENKKISIDLAKHGCVKAKTHILEFPQLDRKLYQHFIRGYFDGDGCITVNSTTQIPNISITSTEMLLTEIQNILIEKSGLSKTKFVKRHKDRKDKITTMCYCGHNNALKFYHYIYHKTNLFLQRKKDKFEQVFKEKNLKYE